LTNEPVLPPRTIRYCPAHDQIGKVEAFREAGEGAGYSPAYDEGAITGTLVIVTEMTAGVLAAGRLEALAWLGRSGARCRAWCRDRSR